jgi:hypothetical protein
MALTRIPDSAWGQFTSIKAMHRSERGVIVFAILKNTGQSLDDARSHRALRLVNTSKAQRVTKTIIESLKAIQHDTGHPIARVFEYDPNMIWYTMSPIQGLTVGHLLGNMYTNGLPPCLVFRVLDQYMSAQKHLQERSMCQIEARGGSNIMLSIHQSNHIVPKVTMIDYSSIMTYSGRPGQDKVLVEDFIDLARTLTQGHRRVLDHYRRTRDGETFERKDELLEPDWDSLLMADWFYSYVARWSWNGVQTLRSLWEEEQLGLRLSALVEELLDEGLAEELRRWLTRPIVKAEEIERVANGGGLDRV